jgi:hypothetical protein
VDFSVTDYDATATLPRRASDTGPWQNGRRLWLSRDKTAAYLVEVSDVDNVERWPAAKKPIGCA